jgi:hypothetical protein
VPSLIGLLEDRELAARSRVEELRERAEELAERLRAAEQDWQHLVIARQTLAAVLAAVLAEAGQAAVAAPAPEPAPAEAAPTGSVVPPWRPGTEVSVLAVEYQRILAVLAGHHKGSPGLKSRQIAEALGIEATPGRIEGQVRSRAKRLAARGWLHQTAKGSFTLGPGPAAAS